MHRSLPWAVINWEFLHEVLKVFPDRREFFFWCKLCKSGSSAEEVFSVLYWPSFPNGSSGFKKWKLGLEKIEIKDKELENSGKKKRERLYRSANTKMCLSKGGSAKKNSVQFRGRIFTFLRFFFKSQSCGQYQLLRLPFHLELRRAKKVFKLLFKF